MGSFYRDGRMIVTKDYPVSSGKISKEKWDEIFPGKQKFEEAFGKIIKSQTKYEHGSKIEVIVFWSRVHDKEAVVTFKDGKIVYGQV